MWSGETRQPIAIATSVASKCQPLPVAAGATQCATSRFCGSAQPHTIKTSWGRQAPALRPA